jgi:hypothetical protein
MQNPTDEIIHLLGIGECTMAALMSKYPETGPKKPLDKRVDAPE